MNRAWLVIGQIAFTYIGTVVGAGFASGQEILHFFTRYGSYGTLGIILSTGLFVWLGARIMRLAHRIGAYSYQEFNAYLFGPALGRLVNVFMPLILLGVTSVMLSGTGAIFREQLGLPYQAGILVTLALTYFVIARGISGILAVNSLVVPLMLLFTVLLALDLLRDPHAALSPSPPPHDGGRWSIAPFTYVAFNLAMALSVLVPLGSEMNTARVLTWGGWWGGIGLGIMLLVNHLVMAAEGAGIFQFEIPMARIVRELGQAAQLLFLLVVYGEIFTTLIANIYGLTRQFQQLLRWPEKPLILALLAVSFVISQFGFDTLVAYLYPAFGYVGLALLVMAALKRG